MSSFSVLCRGMAVIMPWSVTGCALSPSLPVFGAAFPGWFFCLLAGALLLIPCHIVVIRYGWQSRLSPLVISYLALMFIFAALFWFLLFTH